MTRDVITVSPDTSVTDVARLMTDRHFRHPRRCKRVSRCLVTEVDVVSREIDVDPPATGHSSTRSFAFRGTALTRASPCASHYGRGSDDPPRSEPFERRT